LWADGIAHLWSLCVEEHFYLCWPLCLVLFGRKTGLYILFATLTVSPVVRFAFWRTYEHIGFFSPARFDTLAVGCLLAYAWRSERAVAYLLRFRRLWPLAVAVLLVSALLLSPLSWSYFLGPRRLIDATA